MSTTTTSIATARDNRTDWDIDPDLQTRTDETLDKLHDVARGVLDLCGPNGLRDFDGTNPVDDSKRHACTIGFDLPTVEFDCRGNIKESVVECLRDAAVKLADLADEIHFAE